MTAPAVPIIGVLSTDLQALSRPARRDIADEAGVTLDVVMRIWRGRPAPANVVIRLCAVLGRNPHTGEKIVPRAPGDVAFWFAGLGVAVKRMLAGDDMRAAAPIIGVSASTISALERGRPVAIECLLRFAKYLDVNALDMIEPLPSKGVSDQTRATSDQACASSGFTCDGVAQQ